jgi:hypothetical protein
VCLDCDVRVVITALGTWAMTPIGADWEAWGCIAGCGRRRGRGARTGNKVVGIRGPRMEGRGAALAGGRLPAFGAALAAALARGFLFLGCLGPSPL